MSSLGRLNIELTLEQAKFQANLDKAQRRAKEFSEKTQSYLGNIEKAMLSINKSNTWAKNLFGFSVSKDSIQRLVNYADSYTELRNKMALVTDGISEQERAMANVLDISMRTAQSLEATSSVYQTFSQNAKQLGLNQAQVASLTETVSKAVAISGASTATASNALIQFSQSLLMGKLKAQEFNSLMTQTPAVIQAIASGLGLTTAQLKAMVDKGEITAEKMIEGLEKAKKSVDELHQKTALTVSGAFTNLNTAMTKFVGEADQAYQVSSNLAKGIDYLAQNLDSAIKAATLFTGALLLGHLGKYTALLGKTAIQSANNAKEIYKETKAHYENTKAQRLEAQATMASLNAQYKLAQSEQTRKVLRDQMQVQSQRIIALVNAEAAAKRNLAVASRLATTALNGLKKAMALVGGPAGVATIAASALIYFAYQAKEARESALDTASANDRLAESYDNLTEAALTLKIHKQLEELENYEKQINKTKLEIDNIQQAAWQFGLPNSEKELKKIQKLQAKLETFKENKNIDLSVLEKQLTKLGELFIRNGKTVDEFHKYLNTMGVSAEISEKILANLPTTLEDIKQQSTESAEAILNFDEAIKKLNERSENLAQKLAVLTLESQGHQKEAYILSGLYEVLGEKGMQYAKVLEAIAKGDVAAAESAAKAISLSAESLNTMFDMANQLSDQYGQASQVKQIEQNIKIKTKTKSSSVDYTKQYTDQITDMQQRLASLKANAEDIKLYGQVSQYQEVNKLTQDIATNAEKYKNFGAEGVANLLKLAAQIDSAHQQVAINQFEVNNNAKLEALEFELTLLGKTRQEQELLRYGNQLDIEAARLRVGMSQENIAKLDEEIAKLKERYAIIQAQREQSQKDPVQGIKNGIQTIEDDVTNVAKNVENITVNAFNGMSDALTDFVMTGKADFRSLVTSILSDITKMIIKMMLFNAIKQAASSMGYGFSEGGYVGFSSGGFTGPGGKYTPAGIVHKGEYVITKEATSRLGVDYLNYLNYGTRGFANGGGVGVPKVPTMPMIGSSSSQNNEVNITIHIDQNGNTETDTQQTAEQAKQLSQMIQVQVLDVLAKQKRAGGMLA